MYPIFTISDYSFSSYHVINILAILIFIISLKFLIERSNLTFFDFLYYISFIFITGFLGSKLFYLLEDLDFNTFKYKFSNIRNGYVLYGGLIFTFLGSFYYAKNKKIDKLLLLDLNAISFCLSISIGKMACLASGCCYGISTNLDCIGLVYTNNLCLAFPKNEPLFPIQIMDGLFAFLLFVIFLFFKIRNKIKSGRIFFAFCVSYPIYRFFSEYFRADISRGFVLDGLLSLSQLYSLIILVLFVAGFVVFIVKKKLNSNKII